MAYMKNCCENQLKACDLCAVLDMLKLTGTQFFSKKSTDTITIRALPCPWTHC